MIQQVIDFYTNSGVVQFFFWFPVVFNMIVYPFHIWYRIQKDRQVVRDNERYHTSFMTVGEIFKYLFLTFVPVLNALDVIFHSAPIAFRYLCEKFDWLFKIQLVKDTRPKS